MPAGSVPTPASPSPATSATATLAPRESVSHPELLLPFDITVRDRSRSPESLQPRESSRGHRTSASTSTPAWSFSFTSSFGANSALLLWFHRDGLRGQLPRREKQAKHLPEDQLLRQQRHRQRENHSPHHCHECDCHLHKCLLRSAIHCKSSYCPSAMCVCVDRASNLSSRAPKICATSSSRSPRICTVSPTWTIVNNFSTSLLRRRMHPCDAACPIDPGALVP